MSLNPNFLVCFKESFLSNTYSLLLGMVMIKLTCSVCDQLGLYLSVGEQKKKNTQVMAVLTRPCGVSVKVNVTILVHFVTNFIANQKYHYHLSPLPYYQ